VSDLYQFYTRGAGKNTSSHVFWSCIRVH
jgi:hypothetical protein